MEYQIRCQGLPLAVYREVAAHLGQVDGVETELVSQQSRQFDYGLSQIDRLIIHYPSDASPAVGAQVQQILTYYSDRYGVWETVAMAPTQT